MTSPHVDLSDLQSRVEAIKNSVADLSGFVKAKEPTLSDVVNLLEGLSQKRQSSSSSVSLPEMQDLLDEQGLMIVVIMITVMCTFVYLCYTCMDALLQRRLSRMQLMVTKCQT